MTHPEIIKQIQEEFKIEELHYLEEVSPEEMVRYAYRNTYTRDTNDKKKVTGLNLRTNQITGGLEELLKDLPELQALNLSENELTDLAIPAELKSLRHLDISENKALSKLTFEGVLPELQRLDANECALQKLVLPNEPESEKRFENLNFLDLSRNKVLAEINFEGNCPKLEYLDLSENHLRSLELPAGFGALHYLYLNDNQIEQLILNSFLPRLSILHLRNNKLKELPEDFLNRFPALETLYLYNNSSLNLPAEVIASGERKNSLEEVRNYFRSIKKSKRMIPLHQAKMILVGNGEVGKTSIRCKLLDRSAMLPKPHERTQGLDIIPYPVKSLERDITKLEEEIDFQLNIWDFGGQGRYREIQQLFCSRKSLYLFVTSVDDSPSKDDYIGYEYWLNMVNAYGFDDQDSHVSPVIHVVNKLDLLENQEIEPVLINAEERHRIFPNIYPQFVQISCITLENFEGFTKVIRKVIPKISKDVFTNQFADFWMQVKEELETRKVQNHITYTEYLAICREHGMDESEAGTWIDILDRIGVVIYFKKHPQLNNWVILNPIWVKDALYTVMDSRFVKLGVLGTDFFPDVWPQKTPEEREKIIQLMLEYQLCYQRKDSYGQPEYILPARLPEDKPVTIPERLQIPDVHIKFSYDPFIPAGTVNKLIVQLQQNVVPTEIQMSGREKNMVHGLDVVVYQSFMWRNNVIIQDTQNDTYAHIREDWEDKSVFVGLFGKEVVSLYEFIVDILQELNQTLKDTKILRHLELEAQVWYEDEWFAVKKLNKLGIDFFHKISQTETSKSPMDHIRKLISQGRLSEALDTLYEEVPKNYKAETTGLQSRLSKLEGNSRRGIISNADENLERNQIVDGALELIRLSSLDTEDAPGTSPSDTPIQPSIYFSYSWGDIDEEDNENMVDQLYNSLDGDGFKVLRDKMDVQYGGLISTYMEELGAGDLILVFVSDKYVKSPYCMFELYEIARNSKWDKSYFSSRILPIPLERIRFDRPQTLREYFRYWDKEEKDWDDFLKEEMSSRSMNSQWDRYSKVKEINQHFGDLSDWLADINASDLKLLSDNDFDKVKQAILDRIQSITPS